MSADVHPAGTGPLAIPAGTTGPLVPFTEHAAVDPATGRVVMFLRVVQIGDVGPTTPAPGLRLAAGTGPAVDLGTAPTPIGSDPAATPVALATRTDEPDALTLVEVEVLQPGQTWQLQIVNQDVVRHGYVWVVADTDAATLLPWLDLPSPEPAFTAFVGDPAQSQLLPVANHGPGPLTLDDPDGADLGSGFTLLEIAPRPIGANARGTALIGFTTPPAPGRPSTTHTFASNDLRAGAVTGHNDRVTVTATVHPAPRWVPGDVLVLTRFTLGRLDRATGLPVPVTTGTDGAVDLAVDPTTGDVVLLGIGFLVRVDRFTGAWTILSGISGLVTPVAVDVDHDGTVVVLDVGARALVRLTAGGARADIPLGMIGVSPNSAKDMALEASGDAVVSCLGPGNVGLEASVWRIDRAGVLTTLAADDGLRAPVRSPRPIIVQGDGTILTAHLDQAFPGDLAFSAGTLVRVAPQPGTAQPFMVQNPTFVNTVSLAVAADGTILVSGEQGLFAVHPQFGNQTQLSDVSGARIAVVPPLATP